MLRVLLESGKSNLSSLKNVKRIKNVKTCFNFFIKKTFVDVYYTYACQIISLYEIMQFHDRCVMSLIPNDASVS